MILGFLFPRRCVSCNKLGKYFCLSCRKLIKYIEFPFCPVCRYPSVNGITHPRCFSGLTLDGVFTAAHYNGPVKKSIRLAKYSFVSDLLPELTQILFEKFPAYLQDFDFLIPVPLHFSRGKSRGFNQANIIAKIINSMTGIPMMKDNLYRRTNTKPQFGLKPKERAQNIKNVFYLKNSVEITGKKICLVDDVATTFSTLNECAKILKKNGAVRVWAIVLAHGN